MYRSYNINFERSIAIDNDMNYSALLVENIQKSFMIFLWTLTFSQYSWFFFIGTHGEANERSGLLGRAEEGGNRVVHDDDKDRYYSPAGL